MPHCRLIHIILILNNYYCTYGYLGYVLDMLARKSLWDVGLDYRHGTGHGVGAFLNVHEGNSCIM